MVTQSFFKEVLPADIAATRCVGGCAECLLPCPLLHLALLLTAAPRLACDPIRIPDIARCSVLRGRGGEAVRDRATGPLPRGERPRAPMAPQRKIAANQAVRDC